MIRRTAAVTLLVIGTLIAPLAAVAVWGRSQVLDTDAYVRTVTPLAGNAAIQDAVHARITGALPAAAGTTAQAEADRAIDQVLRSDAFERLWSDANRVAHDQIVKLLTGRGATQVAGDKVVLDLTPVAQRVLADLHRTDPATFVAVTLPPGSLTFALFPADDLEKAQTAVRWLDRLAWVGAVLALVFLGASVVVARQRRVALARAGLGLAIGMALLLAVVGLARPSYLDAVDNVIARPAADALFDVILRTLRHEALFAIVAGVAIAVVAGLAGRRGSPRAAVRTVVISAACLAVGVSGIPSATAVYVTAGLAVAGLAVAQLLPRATTP